MPWEQGLRMCSTLSMSQRPPLLKPWSEEKRKKEEAENKSGEVLKEVDLVHGLGLGRESITTIDIAEATVANTNPNPEQNLIVGAN
jgi:hypothetical protein